jgi:uncharacterized protein (DUF1330 family)
MAAYVIAYLDVTDPEAFADYRQAARATFAPYSGKPVVVDGRFEVLEGMIHPRSVVVIEFESMEQAKRWYASPEYGKLVAARQRASESSLLLVEGV